MFHKSPGIVPENKAFYKIITGNCKRINVELKLWIFLTCIHVRIIRKDKLTTSAVALLIASIFGEHGRLLCTSDQKISNEDTFSTFEILHTTFS